MALIQSVQRGTVGRRLPPFLIWRSGRCLQPWLNICVLSEEIREIHDQIFDYGHVRQGVDTDGLPGLIDRFGTRDGICAVNVHTAGAANSLAAGTSERESRIDIVLNPD